MFTHRNIRTLARTTGFRNSHTHRPEFRVQDYHIFGLKQSCDNITEEIKELRQEITYLKNIVELSNLLSEKDIQAILHQDKKK